MEPEWSTEQLLVREEAVASDQIVVPAQTAFRPGVGR
jgi:hypothetical protein